MWMQLLQQVFLLLIVIDFPIVITPHEIFTSFTTIIFYAVASDEYATILTTQHI